MINKFVCHILSYIIYHHLLPYYHILLLSYIILPYITYNHILYIFYDKKEIDCVEFLNSHVSFIKTLALSDRYDITELDIFRKASRTRGN